MSSVPLVSVPASLPVAAAVASVVGRPWIALVNYGMGNLRSVAKALEASGAVVRLVEKPEQIDGAAGLVLPGVGALPDCVAALESSGIGNAVRAWIQADKPFLGVCLGMQALFDSSEEGDCRGLGIFPGRVVRFRLPPQFKVPHIGWNPVKFTQPNSPLAKGMNSAGESFYFVHSYHCVPADKSLVLGECDYGGPFVAAIGRGRVFATQCHPEKSQVSGLRLYRNFVSECVG